MIDDRQYGLFDRTSFSLEKGEQRKEQGIALAAEPLSRKQLLEIARLYAAKIARSKGWVTYDDVFEEMQREGLEPQLLGNAAGCVFRGEQFAFTGRWEKSQRVSNHARVNRVWRLA